MKGTKGLFRLGMIALALSFMVLAGCDTGNGGGGGGETILPAEKGKLTITSLPAFLNNTYAVIWGIPFDNETKSLIGCASLSGTDARSTVGLVKVENNKVIIPLYYAEGQSITTLKAYEGNGTINDIEVQFLSVSSIIVPGHTPASQGKGYLNIDVTFTNGNGEANGSGATEGGGPPAVAQ